MNLKLIFFVLSCGLPFLVDAFDGKSGYTICLSENGELLSLKQVFYFQLSE